MIKKTFINAHLIKNKLVQVDTSQIEKQIHFYKKIKNGIEIDYGELFV